MDRLKSRNSKKLLTSAEALLKEKNSPANKEVITDLISTISDFLAAYKQRAVTKRAANFFEPTESDAVKLKGVIEKLERLALTASKNNKNQPALSTSDYQCDSFFL